MRKLSLYSSRSAAFAFIAWLILVASHTAAMASCTVVTVGDPHDPGALAPAVQAAYTQGARKIIILPGVYVLPNVGHTVISLNGWKDTTLSAYGVTLILTDLTWTHDGIDLTHCTHVTLEGPTLSQNQVTAYQGRIVGVSKGTDGKPYVDWRPDVGYPIPPVTDKKGFLGGDVNVVDAHTRMLKVGDGDFYGVTYRALGNGTFRAQMGGDLSVGDWLVGRYGDAPFKVFVSDSRDCTIKNVTMMRNGFAPLREDGGGGNHYLHDAWMLGPRPAGATENPLVTNAADGMHMTGAYPGPDIEDCVMTGVFLDDCIAVHGGFTDVTAVNANVVTVKSSQWNIGDPIQLADTQGDYQEATVVALASLPDGQWNVTLNQPATIHFVEDKSASSVSGDTILSKATNPLRDGAGYKVIGCHIGDTRSRGMLLKGSDGLVRGNVIAHCGMSAVSLGPEFYWNEAGYVHRVTVEDNALIANGGATYGGAAIFVHGDGAMGNSNITIQDNHFVGNTLGDLDIEWARNITVRDNRLAGPAAWPSKVSPQAAVTVSHCAGVKLQGNVVDKSDTYAAPLVNIGKDVTGLTNADSGRL